MQLQVPISSQWVTAFDIPDTFTRKTMKVIQQGVPTKASRTEIVNAMHSRMIQYNTRPTPFEYKTACDRLVTRHSSLKDRTASEYGTWKEQLKQKFRNGRRPDTQEREQMLAEKENQPTSEPQQKKRKVSKNDRIASQVEEFDNVDSNCYEDKLRKLSEELEKDTPRNKKIKSLMRATFDGRRQWVLQDAPGVSEVLQVFPPLKKSSRLRDELNMILKLEKGHDYFKDWCEWERKIFSITQIEAGNRTSMRQLFSDYLSSCDQQSSDDLKTYHSILILTGFLAARAKSKVLYEYPDTADLDSVVSQLPPAPAIVMLESDSGMQYYVTVEKEILTESEDMRGAVIDMFAAYFAFDIAYPKQLYPVFIFIQHQMLGITDNQPIPNIVQMTLASMNKL